MIFGLLSLVAVLDPVDLALFLFLGVASCCLEEGVFPCFGVSVFGMLLFENSFVPCRIEQSDLEMRCVKQHSNWVHIDELGFEENDNDLFLIVNFSSWDLDFTNKGLSWV